MSIDSRNFGASFSLHRCSELGLDKRELLHAALHDLGCRRFRLMSYWNIHEQKQGQYDFTELDWQLDMIAAAGGTVTLSIGKRQPRWPECHIPDWAAALPKTEWYEALFDYIAVVVERYKKHPALASWQLENESLLKSFGYCPDKDYSHARLRHELAIVKELDPAHPVVMTLSDSWGLPIRRPKPDEYAMSLYRITINKKGRYRVSKRPAWFYRARAAIIGTVKRRPTFIHELQAEPWLPKSLLEVPLADQLSHMDERIFWQNVGFAVQTGMRPIDLWGLEWWWWLAQNGHEGLWDAARKLYRSEGR